MPELMLLSNPRRRRGGKKTVSRKRRTSARKSSKRRSSRKSLAFRSNPIRLGRSGGMVGRAINQQLVPAAKMAGGALAVDIAFGYLGRFIPAQFSAGVLRHVTKAVGAIALSAVAANFIKGSTANEMAKGALTVTLHDAAKELLAASVPGVPLGFYTSGYVAPAARLGMYRRRSSLGYYTENNVTDLQSARRSSRRVGIGQ